MSLCRKPDQTTSRNERQLSTLKLDPKPHEMPTDSLLVGQLEHARCQSTASVSLQREVNWNAADCKWSKQACKQVRKQMRKFKLPKDAICAQERACLGEWIMHVSMHVWMHERIMYVWMYECMNVRMYECMSVCRYTCMYVRMFACLFVCVLASR